MKILFLTIGNIDVASSRARVYSYLEYLKEAGVKTLVLPYTSPRRCRKILLMEKENIFGKMIGRLYSIRAIFSLFLLAPFFDIIYIQKVRVARSTFGLLSVFNKRIIFDFDDSLHLYGDISYLLHRAACVVVSNDYLRRLAMRYNDNIYELISPVAVDGKRPAKKGEAVKVGWIGSPEASQYLATVIPVLKSLMKQFKDLKVIFMGAPDNAVFRSAGIDTILWSIDGERAFLKEIDIGIMPLTDDDWTRGKGGYKLLQYMANGIPCVASPVGVNNLIVEDGQTGFFARSEKEWHDKLEMFLKKRNLINDMGKRALARAREVYSYDANFPKFLKMVNSCL